MPYYVNLTKQKRGADNKFVREWYYGGDHVFDSLNKARADAIKMYLRGWYSGMSVNISQCFGKFMVPGVSIKNSINGIAIGGVVRYRGEFYWALNDKSKKKYRLNMNGSVKSDDKKSTPRTNEFGLDLNLR